MNYHHVQLFLKCQHWASHTLAAYGLTEMDYFSSEERKSYTAHLRISIFGRITGIPVTEHPEHPHFGKKGPTLSALPEETQKG